MAKPPAISPTRWLILLLVPLGWCLAEAAGWLTVFEQRSLDWRFRLRGERTAPVKLLYVDVDSPSLSAIDGWPWSRHYLAVGSRVTLSPG